MPGCSETLTAMTFKPLKNGQLFLTLQMRPFLTTASEPPSPLAYLQHPVIALRIYMGDKEKEKKLSLVLLMVPWAVLWGILASTYLKFLLVDLLKYYNQ
jgi:hypothetical protein